MTKEKVMITNIEVININKNTILAKTYNTKLATEKIFIYIYICVYIYIYIYIRQLIKYEGNTNLMKILISIIVIQ